jgi:hypothetical protein
VPSRELANIKRTIFHCTLFTAQIYFLHPTLGAELPSARALVSFAGNPNWKGKYFNAWTYRKPVVSA